MNVGMNSSDLDRSPRGLVLFLAWFFGMCLLIAIPVVVINLLWLLSPIVAWAFIIVGFLALIYFVVLQPKDDSIPTTEKTEGK